MMSTICIDNREFQTVREAQHHLRMMSAKHTMSCVLPLPPSVNAAYADLVKKTRDSRVYVRRIASKALKAYKQEVYFALLSNRLLTPVWRQAKQLAYSISVYVRRSNADTSNYLKAYEDAVTEALGVDDRHIVSADYDKRVDTHNPRIEGHWYILEVE